MTFKNSSLGTIPLITDLAKEHQGMLTLSDKYTVSEYLPIKFLLLIIIGTKYLFNFTAGKHGHPPPGPPHLSQ